MTIEAKLKDLGLQLPPSPKPAANYVPCVRAGDLLFLSGHGPTRVENGETRIVRGKVGRDLTIEEAYAAARTTTLNLLRTVKDAAGDLGRVKRVVKLLVLVNSAPGFVDQPKVANGASDLLVELFGDRGRHARSAVGAAELPFDMAVEIEAVFEVEE